MLLVAEKVVVVVSECGEITCVLDLDFVLSRVSDDVFEWPNALSDSVFVRVPSVCVSNVAVPVDSWDADHTLTDFVIGTVNVTVADCV